MNKHQDTWTRSIPGGLVRIPVVGEYLSKTSEGEGGIYNSVNLNLYLYAGNNPVHYVDTDGNKILPIQTVFLMNSGPWENERINNSNDKMKSYGCAITAMANIFTNENYLINGGMRDFLQVDPSMINMNVINFTGEGKDCLNFIACANNRSLTATGFEDQSGRNKLLEMNDSNKNSYAVAQVPYTLSDGNSGLHWVNVNGDIHKDENGESWIKVGPTSKNDNKFRANYNNNWKEQDNNMYVKLSAVQRVIVVDSNKQE